MKSPDKLFDQLLIVIIQSQDAENTCQAFKNKGISVFQLPSTGGFLRRNNVTLLIGSNKKIWRSIVQTLKKNCKKRIEYMPINIDGMMTPIHSSITQIIVGGATLFSIDVELCEVL